MTDWMMFHIHQKFLMLKHFIFIFIQIPKLVLVSLQQKISLETSAATKGTSVGWFFFIKDCNAIYKHFSFKSLSLLFLFSLSSPSNLSLFSFFSLSLLILLSLSYHSFISLLSFFYLSLIFLFSLSSLSFLSLFFSFLM